jgi:ferredoxin--NADP+ reductase
MLRVAVVGSGPAGLYTAEALIKQAALLPVPVRVRVDVLDRLPTPYGLVRYGVAPDHKSIKSVANYLRRVLESPDVTFVGGVTLGVDFTREELLAAYDAVVYATGAMRDRRLGIDGEDLPGSYAATDFVNWYCGHPDVDPGAFTLDAESVAVIGVGNVAVDVARILIRDPAELEATDIPEPVMDALRASRVREVHVIGRRGPAQAKFTTKELRELGELAGVSVTVPSAELALTGGFDLSGESAELAAADRRVRGNLVAMTGWDADAVAASGAGAQAPRQLRLRFWLRPVAIEKSAEGTVGGLRVERTRLSPSGVFEGTGEFETIDAQMVLRSVGYQSVPLPDVPFDGRSCIVPNAVGRVLAETGEPLPGEYVAGWLKRGPTGVIGTNKADAAETVQALLADLAGGPVPGETQLPRPGLLRLPTPPQAPGAPQSPTPPQAPGAPQSPAPPQVPGAPQAPDGAQAADGAQGPDDPLAPDDPAEGWALAELLAARGIDPVSYTAWLRISAAEEELARSLGRGERVKLPHRDAVWSAARSAQQAGRD